MNQLVVPRFIGAASMMRSLRTLGGQREHEARPVGYVFVQPQIAAHVAGQPAGKRQAESHAGCGVGGHCPAWAGTPPGEPLRDFGGVKIPADYPLARNEHPRLLFTKAQLPAIKARLTRSPLQEDLQLLKRTLDEGLRQGSSRAENAVVGGCPCRS